jgi:hypothetical protein
MSILVVRVRQIAEEAGVGGVGIRLDIMRGLH